jgi:hypothetical protein
MKLHHEPLTWAMAANAIVGEAVIHYSVRLHWSHRLVRGDTNGSGFSVSIVEM